MASGGSERDRFPQFTSSNYEIPSWQIPWNKPWYQQFQETPNTQSKYNSRGHVLDCKCSLCEEDMESAFSPQPTDVTHIFKMSTKENQEETFPSREKQEKTQNKNKNNKTPPLSCLYYFLFLEYLLAFFLIVMSELLFTYKLYTNCKLNKLKHPLKYQKRALIIDVHATSLLHCYESLMND